MNIVSSKRTPVADIISMGAREATWFEINRVTGCAITGRELGREHRRFLAISFVYECLPESVMLLLREHRLWKLGYSPSLSVITLNPAETDDYYLAALLEPHRVTGRLTVPFPEKHLIFTNRWFPADIGFADEDDDENCEILIRVNSQMVLRSQASSGATVAP